MKENKPNLKNGDRASGLNSCLEVDDQEGGAVERERRVARQETLPGFSEIREKTLSRDSRHLIKSRCGCSNREFCVVYLYSTKFCRTTSADQ
jgi:hypothetical protein